MKKLLLAFFALIALVASTSAVSAQENEEQPPAASNVVIHRVDATSPNTELSAIATNYSLGVEDIKIVQKGEELAINGVTTAQRSERPQEFVFIIDTSQNLAQGNVFETAKRSFAEQVRNLPGGSSVAVVSAGDTAIVVQEMTTNLSGAADKIEGLNLSESAALFNSIDRGAAQFTPGPNNTVRTMIVFSGSADVRSAISGNAARTAVLQRTIQVISVQHNGGEAALRNIVDTAGGVALSSSDPATVGDVIGTAVSIGSDRLLISFAGTSDPTVRGDATMTVAGQEIEFSYPGGILTERKVALASQALPEAGGIAFFQGQIGLFVVLSLVFLAVGLGAFSLGSLFLGGESNLEGLLNRYSGEGDGAALDEEENAIVQTALVKRAVEISESFAEDRGFLVKVEEMLEKANLPLRAGEAMAIFVAGIFFSMFLGFFLMGGLIGAVIFGIVGGIVMIVGTNFRASRRIRKFEQQLPDTLQLLAGTLRAGYSLPQGLEAVSHEISDPMGFELRRVMTEARLGRELEDALGSAAERLSSPDFAWAVMAIGIQREVGGNLNELLMTVSDTMIARERLKGEVAALTAEGKMSAILLGGLPPGLGFIMWIMNPEYINQLFVTTLGNILLGLGVVAALIGFAWMKKVITINV